MLRTGSLPLSQIAKRLSEKSKINNVIKPKKKFPLVDEAKQDTNHEIAGCIGNYKKIYLSEQFVLSNDGRNKWFLTKCAQIVEMVNVTFNKGILCIYG